MVGQPLSISAMARADFVESLCLRITTHIVTFVHNNNDNKPVIIGATGTISKPFRQYVSTIPGNHDVRELQKTAILGTAHRLRKVLM
jgi:hypothetical protein